MTDWNTFLQTVEFRSYRKKQAELIAVYVEGQSRQLMNGGNSSESIASMNGALKMAGMMLDLPERLIKDPKIMESLKHHKQEDIAELSQYLIRRALLNE